MANEKVVDVFLKTAETLIEKVTEDAQKNSGTLLLYTILDTIGQKYRNGQITSEKYRELTSGLKVNKDLTPFRGRIKSLQIEYDADW